MGRKNKKSGNKANHSRGRDRIPLAPANNASRRTGEAKKPHRDSHDKRGDAKKKSPPRDVAVFLRSPRRADATAVRAVLEADDLPRKLRSALGGAKLALDCLGDFVVRGEVGDRGRANCGQVRRMLEKQDLPGWLEWFQVRT